MMRRGYIQQAEGDIAKIEEGRMRDGDGGTDGIRLRTWGATARQARLRAMPNSWRSSTDARRLTLAEPISQTRRGSNHDGQRERLDECGEVEAGGVVEGVDEAGVDEGVADIGFVGLGLVGFDEQMVAEVAADGGEDNPVDNHRRIAGRHQDEISEHIAGADGIAGERMEEKHFVEGVARAHERMGRAVFDGKQYAP